ncbi:NAD(P)/FAD-dependent oxidoreductase [Microlunatus sp. Gsoil 973]|uniref:FAD-dependent oxidoreductase n=1 Tax=Microlunatus sp. Gsoil 973 TaxID=2672569 RepID=UPI0018A82C2C|nr:NAD(P)/FAD-dependent oxidoreductase [Microlunatus sp. Gsoil 973]
MHTVIIGAGLSGPLLAQGLRRAGVDVTLIERRTPAELRSAGYRIHLDPQGDRALRACLEPTAYELVLRTAGVPGSGWRVLNTELEVLQENLVGQPEDPSEGRHLTVDRQTLREILLDGLDDTVRHGVGFERYRVVGDRISIELDGSSALEADLLVGADGSGSRVRAQRLPDLEVVDVGQLNIFGRTALSEAILPDMPPAALDGFSAVVSPDGRAMPLAAHRFANPPQSAADELRSGLRLSSGHDYLMWVLTVPDAQLPAAGLPPDLVSWVAEQVGSWHPSLATLVTAAEPGSVHATTVRSSRRPQPWSPERVTLIGDAAHPMIPAGIGAAVALADAALLAELVGRAADGESSLLDAIADYEQQMRRYAFDAVEASERRMQA